MDTRDIAFRFQADGRSYATQMLKYAVMRTVFGRIRTDQQAHVAFNRLLRMWRERLVALHKAGLPVSQAKIINARNCPPPGSGGDNNLQPCKLRLCPFCYTRQLLQIRERITAGYLKHYSRLVTYTLVVDDCDKHAEQIHVDTTHSCWQSLADIIDVHKLVRHRIRERVFPDAYGTVCMLNVVPHTLKEAGGSLVGYASINHRCIGLMQELDKPSEVNVPTKGKLYERSNPTQRMLMGAMTRMFTYPAAWLRTDPKLMVEFMAAAHKQRFLTRTGVLRDVNT